ncbi:hypothetical protein ENHAE0001_0105 [Enhydrobacter aerosaccus SK60]|nr:hypothetical protein ENHAE0001_0105 [Enhydrobacter aerosaccus SK60]
MGIALGCCQCKEVKINSVITDNGNALFTASNKGASNNRFGKIIGVMRVRKVTKAMAKVAAIK